MFYLLSLLVLPCYFTLVANKVQLWQNESMKCPNCGASLKPEKIGSTVYWRCSTCGAFWFDNKESDFLTEEEAEKLKSLRPQASFSKLKYACPRDNKPLKFDDHHYRCYSCGGLLTNAQAIIEEKQSKQEQFSKRMVKPLSLSQLKKVVIFASIALFLAINFNLFNALKHRLSSSTQAQQITTNLQIHRINQNKLAIYFNTQEPYQTFALFKNQSREWELPISPEYTLNHFLIVEQPKQKTMVQIKLVSLQEEIEITKPIELK